MAIPSIKPAGKSTYSVSMADGEAFYIPEVYGTIWIGAASAGATFEFSIQDPSVIAAAANWDDGAIIKHSPATAPTLGGDAIKEHDGGITGIKATGALIVRIVT